MNPASFASFAQHSSELREQIDAALESYTDFSQGCPAQLGEAICDRHGPEAVPERFRSFDTICSATQDRQDAVQAMMEDPPDAMIVVGGFNSSNTNHLAALCARSTRTYHIESARGIDVETGVITFKQADTQEVQEARGWLPGGSVEIGLTAGASTPDSLIGATAENILRMEGTDPATVWMAALEDPA